MFWALVLAGVALSACSDPVQEIQQLAKPEPKAGPTLARFDVVSAAERRALPYDLSVGAIGAGAERTYVVAKAESTGRRPAIVFLHGWGTNSMAGYESWITHLARQGLAVVFPVYQQPPYTTQSSFRNAYRNMMAGLRKAFARLPVDRRRVAVTGLSGGGALSEDYASTAAAMGLPRPRALYAIYPARSVFDGPVLLPRHKGRIAPGTRMLTVASKWDEIAGTKWARRILANASAVPERNKRLKMIRSVRLGDHTAPGRDTPEVEDTFWAPLDRLLRRSGVLPSSDGP
ncbi:MAG: alpha/beta hydrolase fold domain-containing protein [Solirubrobacterales bacterium]|nr:alpha/beta hydrolase fold domain-containing protein [Solirubrobacterales bacterium]